ncbi:hypothetical protein ACKLNR_011030 [Fusarium oxysporum f. sp. zingiberi]
MTDPSKFTDIVEHYQVGKLSTTGTCTVLAIRTATALDYANRGVYNFLIRDGAVIKAPGDEWTYKSRKFVWQYDGSVVVTNGTQTTLMNSITFEQGLASTLREVAETTKLVTLFRQHSFFLP